MASATDHSPKWPKKLPPLTPEQMVISNDFMHYWHEVLPKKYGIVDKFNHQYVVRNAPENFERTLEIGAGTGEHLKYETLTPLQEKNYVAVDIRDNMAAHLKQQFSNVQVVVADCQKQLDFPTGYFDRILAVHVLEHLPDLPAAIRELYRLCDKDRGILSIVIPCEGSLAYTLARKISAQRLFEKRYKQSYKWLIEREHINRPWEIFEELKPYFEITHTRYFPFPIRSETFNLCIGVTLAPRNEK